MSVDVRPITRALLSVSDKTGLVEFATALAKSGVELVSTGGTRKALADAGLDVKDVSDLTGFPEMMDGRVKTLHPKVHGGILAIRGDAGHQASLAEHAIAPIDLVVVNLYPFEATVARGAGFDDVIENIDIGGPALIRGAAKNHNDVAVVVDTSIMRRCSPRCSSMAAPRSPCASASPRPPMPAPPPMTRPSPTGSRRRWMRKRRCSAPWAASSSRACAMARTRTRRRPSMPRTSAAPASPARQVQGKQLSFNNINDTDAAFEAVAEFHPARTSAVVIVKHANPCGVAEGASLAEAYTKALACDPSRPSAASSPSTRRWTPRRPSS